jgi:hypothetical protein
VTASGTAAHYPSLVVEITERTPMIESYFKAEKNIIAPQHNKDTPTFFP